MIKTRTSLITLKNVTQALKSKKILKSYGINSTVVKLNKENNDTECTSGIEFNTRDYYAVIDILKKNDISFRSTTGG